MGKKKVITKDEAASGNNEQSAGAKEVRVKAKLRVPEGRIYVSSSYNNTIITLTDAAGQVIASKSAGAVGFKGTKKSTSFAASRVAETIVAICKKLGMEKIEVLIRGTGAGRSSAIRTLVAQGLNVFSIKDVTPMPHNGVRARKVRRV